MISKTVSVSICLTCILPSFDVCCALHRNICQMKKTYGPTTSQAGPCISTFKLNASILGKGRNGTPGAAEAALCLAAAGVQLVHTIPGTLVKIQEVVQPNHQQNERNKKQGD